MNTFDELVRSNNFLVLDTETTGLDSVAEICQIAIIDPYRHTLLDSLVRPRNPIPAAATRIHGISDAMVLGAPQWPELIRQIIPLINNRDVIVYNSEFDYRLMCQSAELWDIPEHYWNQTTRWHCAMNAYARHHGEWDPFHGNYKWQRLTVACRQLGIAINDAHSALGDCLMTLAVVRAMISKTPIR